jgi:hypothetical protein
MNETEEILLLVGFHLNVGETENRQIKNWEK